MDTRFNHLSPTNEYSISGYGQTERGVGKCKCSTSDQPARGSCVSVSVSTARRGAAVQRLESDPVEERRGLMVAGKSW